jgi:hypothetical protein
VTFGHCEAQTGRASPFPSWATERKERDDQARVPGPVSATAPETQGPCSGPPVAKSLVYGPGPGSSWGDRFNTYSRGSTHLGAARPGPGFFLSFGSLKPGRWDLGPGLVGTRTCRDSPVPSPPMLAIVTASQLLFRFCRAGPCRPSVTEPSAVTQQFCRWIKMQNCRVRRTDVVNLYIRYKILLTRVVHAGSMESIKAAD